jgi:hypothetical protein
LAGDHLPDRTRHSPDGSRKTLAWQAEVWGGSLLDVLVRVDAPLALRGKKRPSARWRPCPANTNAQPLFDLQI